MLLKHFIKIPICSNSVWLKDNHRKNVYMYVWCAIIFSKSANLQSSIIHTCVLYFSRFIDKFIHTQHIQNMTFEKVQKAVSMLIIRFIFIAYDCPIKILNCFYPLFIMVYYFPVLLWFNKYDVLLHSLPS